MLRTYRLFDSLSPDGVNSSEERAAQLDANPALLIATIAGLESDILAHGVKTVPTTAGLEPEEARFASALCASGLEAETILAAVRSAAPLPAHTLDALSGLLEDFAAQRGGAMREMKSGLDAAAATYKARLQTVSAGSLAAIRRLAAQVTDLENSARIQNDIRSAV